MAIVHGKEGVIKAGGSVVSDVMGFSLETTGDVVETTALGESVKSFTAGTTAFSGSIDVNFNRVWCSKSAGAAGRYSKFGRTVFEVPTGARELNTTPP